MKSRGGLLNELVDDIYSAGLGEQDWDIVLDKLRVHTNARLVGLLSYDENTRLAAVNKAVGESPEFVNTCLQQYAEEFYLYDPGAPVIGDWPTGRWYEDSLMLLPKQRNESIFHQEFLRPNGMNSISGLFVYRGREGSSFLSFLGGLDSEGFSQALRDEISRLAVHFNRAMRVHLQMDRLNQQQALTQSILEGFSFPLLVLDEHRRLQLANAAGHQLINSEPVLKFNNGRFAPDPCPDDAYWRAACKKGVLVLNRPSGHSLPLSLSPIPVQSALAKGYPSKLILVTAMGLGSHDARVQRLQLVFDLTPTEAELAVLLAYRGMSPQECAESRSVSITTVRTHIQALLNKVNVSRIPQLITAVHQLG